MTGQVSDLLIQIEDFLFLKFFVWALINTPKRLVIHTGKLYSFEYQHAVLRQNTNIFMKRGWFYEYGWWHKRENLKAPTKTLSDFGSLWDTTEKKNGLLERFYIFHLLSQISVRCWQENKPLKANVRITRSFRSILDMKGLAYLNVKHF